MNHLIQDQRRSPVGSGEQSLIVILVLQLALSIGACRLEAAENQSPTEKSALILYDGPVNKGDGLLVARQVGNYMGHFDYKAKVWPMTNYIPGAAQAFSAVFVCGMTDETIVPASLLADLAHREKTTVWIHLHLGQFTALPDISERLGFEYVENDDSASFTSITYHGISLPKTDAAIDRVKLLEESNSEILATSENAESGESVPFVLRAGNFWYVAGRGFSFTTVSDSSLAVADLFHDILGVKHAEKPRALVRIEDVSANSDPDELRHVTDILVAHRVPFQIAVIPVFKDPPNHIDMALFEQPDVVDAIHYMVAHGGTVVMHGVTHQVRGISGIDYEFWDSLANRPTQDGGLSTLRPKLLRGLEECFRVGLYPVAFETPHYAASLEHYRSLATIFSHCYERRIACEDDDTQEYFPFITTDLFGQTIIPENLGYIESENPTSATIIEGARRLKAVRDPIASFFFHPFMPAKYLDEALSALQTNGYQFVSIKDFAPKMSLGEYAIAVQKGQIVVTPQHPFVKIASLDKNGVSTTEIRPVEKGKPVTLEVAPSFGGMVTVQGVAHPSLPDAKLTGLAQWKRRLFGIDPTTLPLSDIHVRRALIVGPAPSFESMLGVFAIPWQRFNPSVPIPDDAFVVIPRQSVLDENAQTKLTDWVGKGGRVILEGHTPMAERLGFDFSGPVLMAQKVQDILVPEQEIDWLRPVAIERFVPPPVNVVLVQETDANQPLAVAARFGDGLAIYLATELDAQTQLGYARFPFLFSHLRQRFRLEPPVSADGVEYYFDPGFRENAVLERLVESWHAEGVRAIYAAANHFYQHWSYDYDRLIRLCHERGIAVYAWLELPDVSQKFWEDHPEWRDKTVTGADAEIGWRKFMNLANPDCRLAVLNYVDELLDRHDWDGVNIAELCFDTTDGLAKPEGYIPMNPDVRAQFAKESGFDPKLLFEASSPQFWKTNPESLEKWTRFRTGLTRDWLAQFLERLSKRKLDVIVTALDSFSVPRVVEKNGCDSRDVIALMGRYKFTLQVEDSEEMWGQSPDRYAHYAETYRTLVSDASRLMFDINVVKDRPSGLAPTALPSGIELALTARSAARAGNGRVAIYSESTVLEGDRALLPFVMASGTTLSNTPNATIISANRPVRFQHTLLAETQRWLHRNSPYAHWPVPIVDGRPWNYGTKGLALLSPGAHTLSGIEDSEAPSAWIKDITAPFASASSTRRGFAIDYNAFRHSWLTLSHAPVRVLSDGHLLAQSAIHRSESGWMIELPAGRHSLEIQGTTVPSMVLERASEKTSNSIVWFATRGVFLLAGLCAASRLRRLVRVWN